MKINKNIFMASVALALMGMGASSAFAFQQSPMLEAQVKAGKLPPVEQRLPTKPRVLDVESIGKFGGIWHRAYKGPGDRWGPTKLLEERAVKFVQDKDGKLKLIPTYIDSYSMSADGKEFTFTLLDGLKWSDGVPVTTEDVKFWYEDVFLNKDIVSTIDTLYAPGGKPLEVEIVDTRTFKVKFAQPYVYFLTILAKDSTGEPSLDRPSFIMPKHYLKNFMPKYADKAALEKVVAEKGVKKWSDLWSSKGPITAWNQNPDLPVITPWKIVTPPPADVMVMERNPYYYMVDKAGNQLPYIDRIEHKLFDGQENFNLMVVQGQIDMQQRYTFNGDFTFYKENEKRGDYKVLKWTNSEVWSLVPNLTVKDQALNALINNIDFRHALSIAIDRDTLNELSQSGLGKSRSASPVASSPYYSEELAKHWAEHDPDKANELLDKIGLTKRDDDGFRVNKDGKRVSIVVETSLDAFANTLEMIRDNWHDIGVELLPRVIDRTQFDANRDNNDFQMQYTSFDRLSIVPSDPRLMLGDDGYAEQYYTWYQTKGASGIEPPKDSPIRSLWADWDKAAGASTIEEADKATNHMIRTFVEQGYVIGLVGETPALVIAKNNLKNVRDGLINDDVTRGEGIAYPAQFYFDK
ncbi:ABC transporter substrate-binding protein [Rhizobium sp.]|jgi:peptide/nickel transport system substrate-binding protein|uniref:ABC transporter substrate-binding protein n=1 Tax=Rhizobium sp. TaxID=391 RepID=UPI000E992C29|nr:peptide ABC transporter substrate-binding protein [Rhizobium sp.]